jgi:tRNA dimethylallyltransferase
MKKEVLIITGPTGVGKTDFVDKVANCLPTEIVNLDLGQFYEPFGIGTAKPDWKSQAVPHHLFDLIKTPHNYTVFQYRTIVIEKIKEIWAREKLPILVGGSGFYLLSLFFPPLKGSEINVAEVSTSWQELQELDPERAAQIDKNDPYRIQRAISIAKSGKIPSQLKPKFDPFCSAKIIVLNRDRDDLYDRINKRTIEMLEEGWVEEVDKLSKEWQQFLMEKKLIGYDDVIKYLNKEISKDKLIGVIRKKTRNYAKRQLTFFRMLERKLNEEKKTNYAVSLDWLHLTLSDLDLYIKQLCERCQNGEIF